MLQKMGWTTYKKCAEPTNGLTNGTSHKAGLGDRKRTRAAIHARRWGHGCTVQLELPHELASMGCARRWALRTGRQHAGTIRVDEIRHSLFPSSDPHGVQHECAEQQTTPE